ncbi:MAG: TmcC family electron transfer complex membrane anchor subunit [Thermodesulfobacteriota bacterium]
MHAVYSFVIGPMAWAAGIVFVAGSIYQLWSIYRLAKLKDPLVLEYMNLKFGLRSILHWSIPFLPVNSRKHPVVTVVTFLFHFCLLFLPVFLTAHVMLWDYYHGFSYWSVSDHAADIMTAIVITACVFFAVRRAARREVRYVTSAADWAVLSLVALPFLTGFLAFHQIGDYQFMIILHIVSGEIWLAAIPFTRLSHMLLAPFTRAYMGSEFGAVRRAKDW